MCSLTFFNYYLIKHNFFMYSTYLKTFAFITAIVFLSSCQILAQGTNITILHVNDSHSHLLPTGPKNSNLEGTIGGIARVSQFVKTEKSNNPNAIFLHAGDYSVGDFYYNGFKGVPELQILKSMGCDALTVGNHEFDLGPAVFNSSLSQAFSSGSFPILSANLDLTGFPQLGSFISPSVIVNKGGVNVGIFGMTTPYEISNASPVVIQTNITEIVGNTVTALQNSGANVIVFLSHLGSTTDSVIAGSIPGIHIIVSGHDHRSLYTPVLIPNPSGFNTIQVSAGEYYKQLGQLVFNYDNGIVTLVQYDLFDLNSNFPEDQTVKNDLDALKPQLVNAYGNIFTQIIASAPFYVGKSPGGTNPALKDSPLGNLVADALKQYAQAEIGITPNGFIAEGFYQGNITLFDVLRSVPYGFDTASGLGFDVMTIDIQGKELIKGLEFGLNNIESSDGYLLQVSGMRYKYDKTKPIGQRLIIPSVRVRNLPISYTKFYRAGVSLGSVLFMQANGIQYKLINQSTFEEYYAVKDLLNSIKQARYYTEGRIKEVSTTAYLDNEEENLPGEVLSFELFGNYPNPFNPVTNIKFSIPENGFVSVKVYDILGQEVDNLFTGNMTKGIHRLEWNAQEFTSGIYFAKVNYANSTKLFKMVLIK